MPASQLPLADDLFLTAHDTVSYKSLLSPATLGIGLATALLGELILWRRIDLQGGALSVVDTRQTGDAASTTVLDQIIRDSHHQQVRDWIAFLATGAALDLIERRLSRSGLVQRQEKRRLLGTRVSYVPRDTMSTGWPGVRIRTSVERGELLNLTDLVLSGLVLATGLDQQVFTTLDSRDRETLFDQLRRRLPAMLQELISHAEAAVGDAVMTGRA